MSFTRDLLVGLAGELTAAGIATYSTGAGGGIYFNALPTSPDRAVSITAYSSVDEPKVTRSTVRVQFWFRGARDDSGDCDDMADATFLLLQGAEDRTYGTAHLVQCNRASSVPLGTDDSKRSSRTDNYEIDLDLPVTPGRPW